MLEYTTDTQCCCAACVAGCDVCVAMVTRLHLLELPPINVTVSRVELRVPARPFHKHNSPWGMKCLAFRRTRRISMRTKKRRSETRKRETLSLDCKPRRQARFTRTDLSRRTDPACTGELLDICSRVPQKVNTRSALEAANTRGSRGSRHVPI